VHQDKTREARAFPSSKLAVLRQQPIFCDLEPEALDQLCRYARHATFKRGAALFSKGDPGTSLFAVVSGTVKMSVSSVDGRSAIFNLVGAGETPIAKSWSWTGANFFPLCEASRRWR
jgi:CRP/FNR family transcriptional regulator, cyclic AMP receptor protein